MVLRLLNGLFNQWVPTILLMKQTDERGGAPLAGGPFTRRQRVAQQIRGMIRYCRYEEGIVGSTINMVHKQRQSVPTIATNYVL